VFVYEGVTTEKTLDNISSLENMFPVYIGLPDVIFYYRLLSSFSHLMFIYVSFHVLQVITAFKTQLNDIEHDECIFDCINT